MKKAISVLLVIVLIAAMGVPAFAADTIRSNQALQVNGVNVTCDIYNIDGNNYFKLRDLAYLLNGTGSQFAVGYDAAARSVTITTGAAYEANGSELVIGADLSSTAVKSAQSIYIDGKLVTSLSVYNIGGNNYFKLRDLGDAVGFDVDYEASTRTMIVTSRGAGSWTSDVITRGQFQEFLNLLRSPVSTYDKKYGTFTFDSELEGFMNENVLGGLFSYVWADGDVNNKSVSTYAASLILCAEANSSGSGQVKDFINSMEAYFGASGDFELYMEDPDFGSVDNYLKAATEDNSYMSFYCSDNEMVMLYCEYSEGLYLAEIMIGDIAYMA